MESMTGFGAGLAKDEKRQVVCEIKSVNQRFLDLQFKMPNELNFLELPLRHKAQALLKRGRVEIFIQLTTLEAPEKKVQLNQEALLDFLTQLKVVEEKIQRDLTPVLSQISQDENFVWVEQNLFERELWQPLVEEAFTKALTQLKDTRKQEGQALEKVLTAQQKEFLEEITALQQANEAIEASHFTRLKDKLTELLGTQVEESRLLTEVAIILEKGDIHEEIDRLLAHVKAFQQLLQQTEPIGRQLDFLIQEMNREVNTIGSKAQDLFIKQKVVGLKTILEKMREQLQNLV